MRQFTLTLSMMLMVLFSSAQVFITEIADPNDSDVCRFVELYNAGATSVDFSTGWSLQRWTNNSGSPQSPVALTGTIAPGGFYIIANNASFNSCYGFSPDQTIGSGGPADSNGDDQLALLDASSTIVDFFGEVGIDGSNTCHEFEDGRVERDATVTTGNPTWTETEWNEWSDSSPAGCTNYTGSTPVNTTDGIFDPGAWIGASAPSVTLVSFTTNENFAGDAGPSVDICVSITNEDAVNPTTVEVALDPSSTATNGGDYNTIVFPVTLTFPAGSTADQCFTIDFIDDLNIEGDETIILNLQNASGGNSAAIGTTSSTQVTIFDDEFATNCTEPAWNVISTQTNSSANNGGEWTPVTGGFSANAYCGSGCAEPADTWLVFGPLDLSSTGYTDLQFDADEGFSGTDLVVAYSTDYGSDPCPSAATWNTLATLTGDDTYNVGFGAAMGSTDVFIGIQYNDDGAGGYSSWEVTNFLFTADVCPSVGTFPPNGCITCSATIAALDGVCDAETEDVDTYTATFSYDASAEVEGLDVTTSAGILSTDTIIPGTSGTITVTDVPEGTDVQVTITNTLCIEAATQSSPSCVAPQVPTCGVGETSLVYDPFEGMTTGIASPAAYEDGADIWATTTDLNAITPLSGGEFWGVSDIDNANFAGLHTITYDAAFVESEFTSINVSFYYYSIGFDGPDEVYYKYSVGANPEDSVALAKNTGEWTEVTLSIPVGPSETSFQLVLGAIQNGSDYLGFDEVNICGSTVPACTASLTLNSVACDDNTAGVDTYTATFDYDATGESEDLTITVTPAADAQSLTTILAGTSGSFTVTMSETTTDYQVDIINTSCMISESVSGGNCIPLPVLVINEVDYDQPESGDPAEFIELYNAGADPIDMSLVTVELVNGSNDAVYDSFVLSGTLAAGDYYVIGSASVPNVDQVEFSGNGLQNGAPDGVRLVYSGQVLDGLSYEGTMAGTGEGTAGVSDSNGITAVGLSRVPDGTDSDDNGVDFVLTCITPGEANVICAANDDCSGAEALTPSVWGVPGWSTHPLGSQESLVGCEGDADDDVWFVITPLSANDAVLARDEAGAADLVIEFFDACDGASLGCFNNYGAGQIERALPGGLTAGVDVLVRVYDSASGSNAANLEIQHKTYQDGMLQSLYCDGLYDLSDALYAERDDLGQLYSNPNVPVKGYSFRFQEQGGGLDVSYNNGPNNHPYVTLANVNGLEYGKTYDVSVSHKVKLQANGGVTEFWSDFGTTCPITLQATVPVTQLRPEFCPSMVDLYLEQQIQAVPVPGATQYRFTFDGPGGPFVEASNNYALFLYNVGAPGAGLQYNSAVYSVTVQALVNGIWSDPGAACVITMASQPEDTEVQASYCGGTYEADSPNNLLAEYVYGASAYEWEFTPMSGQLAGVQTQVTPGLSLSFHLASSLDLSEGGDWSVRVRVLADGQNGSFSTSCTISINSGEVVILTPPAASGLKNLDSQQAFELELYPNPNSGSEFILSIPASLSEGGVVEVEILDITGSLIWSQQEVVKGATSLRIAPQTNLETGIYLVSVTQNGLVNTVRMVVK